jgi:hypothetical protein
LILVRRHTFEFQKIPYAFLRDRGWHEEISYAAIHADLLITVQNKETPSIKYFILNGYMENTTGPSIDGHCTGVGLSWSYICFAIEPSEHKTEIQVFCRETHKLLCRLHDSPPYPQIIIRGQVIAAASVDNHILYWDLEGKFNDIEPIQPRKEEAISSRFADLYLSPDYQQAIINPYRGWNPTICENYKGGKRGQRNVTFMEDSNKPGWVTHIRFDPDCRYMLQYSWPEVLDSRCHELLGCALWGGNRPEVLNAYTDCDQLPKLALYELSTGKKLYFDFGGYPSSLGRFQDVTIDCQNIVLFFEQALVLLQIRDRESLSYNYDRTTIINRIHLLNSCSRIIQLNKEITRYGDD